ncbi:MAG TPA: ABC transporter substrate-binding protein, partial [Clostridia bacterium]|nr:ABC transporter substrate-binding protein [Clostridia bacterium]
LMDNIPNLNPEVKDTMVLPTYTAVSLPDDTYIDKVIQWTADVMKKELNVTAGDLVERKFIEP